MTSPLWTIPELMAASGGKLDRHTRCEVDIRLPEAITGISIDTRSLARGELFVALKDQRDGHEFVPNAFKAEAGAALVSETYERQPGDGVLIRVPDVLMALEAIGRASRARLSPEARVIAVTGSAGKTSTKEMLRACLGAVAPGRVHASDKSFNNHWGVPLTLARMPRDTRYAVFEIGMNHSGEITPLSQMVRPHVAIITTVEAVHLEHFASVEAIADAKAEIFAGLEGLPSPSRGGAGGGGLEDEASGTAILNRDNPHFERLRKAAEKHGSRIVSFGAGTGADVHLARLDDAPGGTTLHATLAGQPLVYKLAAIGHHFAMNSLAVAAAVEAAGAPLEPALAALAESHAPKGRGDRTTLTCDGGSILLIDESYNANPASMRAALSAMATAPRETWRRRIAVLGDMLELGPQSAALHRGLKEAIDAAGVDLVFAAGPHMKLLYDDLAAPLRGEWSETSAGLVDKLLACVRAGDVVMIKGSNGSRMSVLVEALKGRLRVA